LISVHWSSIGATLPNGFWAYDVSPPQFVDGNDEVHPYWNVTIPAGATKTFMLVLNQGARDLAPMYESTMAIDANPLKLYYGKYFVR
jgi:hypothetical protein